MPELEKEIEVSPHLIVRIDDMVLSHETPDHNLIPNCGMIFSLGTQFISDIVQCLKLFGVMSRPSSSQPLFHSW